MMKLEDGPITVILTMMLGLLAACGGDHAPATPVPPPPTVPQPPATTKHPPIPRWPPNAGMPSDVISFDIPATSSRRPVRSVRATSPSRAGS